MKIFEIITIFIIIITNINVISLLPVLISECDIENSDSGGNYVEDS